MFSGKTTYILSKIAELNYQVLYINIEFDNSSEQIFSTHNLFFDNHVDFVKRESIKNNVTMIKSKILLGLDVKDKDVIFVDDLVEFVNNCLDLNKYVIVGRTSSRF